MARPLASESVIHVRISMHGQQHVLALFIENAPRARVPAERVHDAVVAEQIRRILRRTATCDVRGRRADDLPAWRDLARNQRGAFKRADANGGVVTLFDEIDDTVLCREIERDGRIALQERRQFLLKMQQRE